jgi:hypothetical protein
MVVADVPEGPRPDATGHSPARPFLSSIETTTHRALQNRVPKQMHVARKRAADRNFREH